MDTKRQRIESDEDSTEASQHMMNRVVCDIFLRHIEETMCFNRDGDTARWRTRDNFYGSSVQLYSWISKEDKAKYRWFFKIACLLSKAHYGAYRHKRDQMFYRLAPFKLSAFPDAFGPKCLLLLPILHMTAKAQPCSFIHLATIDSLASEHKDNIAYGIRNEYAALQPYIESAGGFLPRDYKPHENSIRDHPVRKLLFEAYNKNGPCKNLIQAIPKSVTSITFGPQFGVDVLEGVLPECLTELRVTNLWETQKYHVPTGLRKLSVSVTNNSRPINGPWITQCFVGLTNQLEYMNLRNMPIVCMGCPKCTDVDHTHGHLEATFRSWLPSGLKTLLMCIERQVNGFQVYPCTIPNDIENLAISIENDVVDTVCFWGCAFPKLKTFLVHGHSCGIDDMIQSSGGLDDLSVAFVHAPQHPSNANKRHSRPRPPNSFDMRRIEFDMALSMLSGAGAEEFVRLTRSVQMIRPRFTDTDSKTENEALVCGSRRMVDYMVEIPYVDVDCDDSRRYVTPNRVDPADFRRKFVRMVRTVSGLRLTDFCHDSLHFRGRKMFKNTLKSMDPLHVRQSLIALMTTEPSQEALLQQSPVFPYPPLPVYQP